MEPNKEETKPYVPTPYAPPAPTATYENGPMDIELRRQINQWAEKNDPQKQAEEDAKIQKGRNFWIGANLFSNVIANAINARGTAKGAPNMTFNDAASQKMYDSWKDADKQLKADRMAAQQRLDALMLQDAGLRHADRQAADKRALDAYNRNYEATEKANQINYGRERQMEDEERGEQRWRDRWDYQGKHPHSSGGGGKGTSDEDKYHFQIGPYTIKANNKWEQDSALSEIARKLSELTGKEIEGGNYNYIVNNFDDAYNNNEGFRNWYDGKYGDSTKQNAGQWQRRPSAKRNPMMTAPDNTTIEQFEQDW